MLGYNAVYQIVGSEKRIRILDIDVSAGMCAYIPLETDRALPILCPCEDLADLIDSGEMIEIVDPFYEVEIPDKYSAKEAKRCEVRYLLVTKYWPLHKQKLLQKHGRAEFLEEIAKQESIPISTLKRLFCQFWQRGMCKSAMISSYINSGGKGKERAPRKKNGSKRADHFEELLIDKKIERIFEIVLKRYYETEKRPSLTRVYYQMLDMYFSKHIKNGDKIDRLLYDEDHYPTFRQFKYYVDRHLDKQAAYIARETESKFNLKRRALSDSAINQIYGPGDCFMIDSTPADIHLISTSNPNKVIGRPTVYIIMDVYSRLVTGSYAGLENPSWDAAAISLQNMVEDKVEYCNRYGITIEEHDWPSHHLPRAMLADRGDMISKRAQGIIKELGVTILNTAPYRGDMKGVVERFFRTMNAHLKESLPGGVHKDHMQRGERDPHTEAALTLEEFQKVIIQAILLHNSTIIKDYPAMPMQIEDGIPSIPASLWNYGIKNRTGSLRSVEAEKLALNVWPHDVGSLSRKGLRFQDLYYGDILLAQKAAGLEKAIKMHIVYNPFTVNYIFVLDGTYRKIYLQPSCRHFENMSFSEYKYYRQTEKANNAVVRRDVTQRRSTYEGMLQKTGCAAEKRRMNAPKVTNASRKSNMREERAFERAEERRNRTTKVSFGEPAKVIKIDKQEPHDYMDHMRERTTALMDELFGDNK